MGIALVIIFFLATALQLDLLCFFLPLNTWTNKHKQHQHQKAVITELVLWSLKYCVFSELHLLTEKKIEANGYGYLEKIIPILCQ